MELMSHQIADARFLAERKVAGCFNGMGTGKTLTSLEACKLVGADRIVIVGPPISLRMWAENVQNWLGLSSLIIRKGKQALDTEASVLICSYDIMTKRAAELAQWAMAGKVSTLICDESHALKSTKAKRTKAVLGSGGIINAFAHAWFLTGTPVTRWNDDLIPFLFRACPQEVKAKIGGLNIMRFNMRYTVTQQRQFGGMRRPVTVTVGSRNTAELGEMLAKVATRRELKEVWDAMPPLTHTRLQVELADRAEVRGLLAEIEGMTMAQIEEAMRSNDEHLATLRRQLGMAMVPDAIEIIDDRVESGLPVVVGAWHTDVIDAIAGGVKADRVAIIDGRTPQSHRDAIERQWNEGKLDVVIGQIGAMGVSLNLQKGGNNIIVVEEDWSPSIMDQFYARLHRMGQEKPVHVDTLFADTKLAKAVARIAAAKRRSHADLSASHMEASDAL